MSRNTEHSGRPKIPSGIISGLALICLGVALVLENLYVIYIDDVLRFCPVVIIAWGLARLWNRGILNIWGNILVVCGGMLLIGSLGYWRGRVFEIYWPVLIIWVGVIISIRAFMPSKPQQTKPSQTTRSESAGEDGWPGWEADHTVDSGEEHPNGMEVENVTPETGIGKQTEIESEKEGSKNG